MTVHLPIVIVLLIVVVLLVKQGRLKTGHALVALLFGFYLKDTQLADPINNLVSTIARALTQLRL
ncbi:hypothetical protein ACH4FX_22790 [Streptomyces sp. NPDC018019]|uniref:hypothetical protein n=1 Tax=Streptomyces sp. NPDC018019 TaxID=3365030 RepID=UPI0037BBA7B7